MSGVNVTRVLLVRTDRIGDVVLCTPAIQALAKARPRWSLSLLVRGPIESLVSGLDSLKRVWNLDEIRGFWHLVRKLRAADFQAVLFFRFDFRVAVACWWAGVPMRLGPISNVWSRVFLNFGMRQRRSRVEKHEADYNVDLLKILGVHAEPEPARVQVPAPELEWGQRFCAENGLKEFLVVHPGMGGSAENWPLQNYRILVERLLAEGRTVVLSVGPQDEAVRSEFKDLRSATGLVFADGLTLPQLGFLLAQASCVVAPSTGPLHLAAALGVPVVGLYPSGPAVETSRRWGPRGPHLGSKVLSPDAGRSLSSLTVEQSLEKIQSTYGA